MRNEKQQKMHEMLDVVVTMVYETGGFEFVENLLHEEENEIQGLIYTLNTLSLKTFINAIKEEDKPKYNKLLKETLLKLEEKLTLK